MLIRWLARRTYPSEMRGSFMGRALVLNRIAAHSAVVLAYFLGGGSLLLFGAFLLAGPFTVVPLELTQPRALVWDGLLCLLFFVQHSGMVRRSFHDRLSAIAPRPYHPAIYAVASGAVLTAVVLLWQAAPVVLFRLEGPARLLPRAASALAIAGFAWAVRKLRTFDPFGVVPIRAGLRGRAPRPPTFVVEGPYLWVRHPLYFFMLVLIGSAPAVTPDRLLFDVLWTAWIVVGCRLEERDLAAQFGDEYRRYQKTVPMLLPWRGPASQRPSST
jgi:methanethiol S-methyltransferase